VTDPRAGAYCQVVLDSGEKLLVNHDKGGTVTVRLDLDSPGGKAVLGRLTAGAPEGSVRATPLGAVVEHLRDCGTLGDVRARLSALSSGL
jgi:hypothetical protein